MEMQGIKSIWCARLQNGLFQLEVNYKLPLSNGCINRWYHLNPCDLLFRILMKKKHEYGSNMYISDLFGITKVKTYLY